MRCGEDMCRLLLRNGASDCMEEIAEAEAVLEVDLRSCHLDKVEALVQSAPVTWKPCVGWSVLASFEALWIGSNSQRTPCWRSVFSLGIFLLSDFLVNITRIKTGGHHNFLVNFLDLCGKIVPTSWQCPRSGGFRIGRCSGCWWYRTNYVFRVQPNAPCQLGDRVESRWLEDVSCQRSAASDSENIHDYTY